MFQNEDVSKAAPTEADIAQANKLKEEGNTLMKDSKFELAVQKYNEAIKLNRDPVYFCNRSVIFNKNRLGTFQPKNPLCD